MKPVFIALDFASQVEALDFLDQFPATQQLAVKVGMELFYNAGPQLLQIFQQRQIQVFLDLKLCDIPHTVQQAAAQLAQQQVAYLTVMALGGSKMIQAAQHGLAQGHQPGTPRPKLLAVTQLTSMSEQQMQQELQVQTSLPESVTHLAQLAQANGADGVIASALEDPKIHQATSANFLCINPGIRLQTMTADDQERIVTPQQAAQLGSDGLVVGRPITRAADPVAVYQQILQEWSSE